MDIDTTQIEALERKVGSLARLGVPIAKQKTLNAAAFETQKVAKSMVKKNMVLRNKWTLGSIQVEKSKGLFKTQTPARVGSLQQYMADQEFGTVARKQGKEGRRITTSYASGEGENARPRRKLARGMNKIQRIKLQRKRQKGRSKRQQAFITIREAAKSGRKFVYLDMPWTKGKKGIYKVIGGKRRPRIKMVHSLKKPSVVVPKNPWLKPSVAIVGPRMKKLYIKELRAQVKRHLPKS